MVEMEYTIRRRSRRRMLLLQNYHFGGGSGEGSGASTDLEVASSEGCRPCTEMQILPDSTCALHLELEDVDPGPSAPSIEHDAILEAVGGGGAVGPVVRR